MAVVDNSVEGQDKKYKLVLPRTNTPLIRHTWNDGIIPLSGTLKKLSIWLLDTPPAGNCSTVSI